MFAGYLYLVLVSLFRLGTEADFFGFSTQNHYEDVQVNGSDSSPLHKTVLHSGLLGVAWSDFEHKHILNEATSIPRVVSGWTRANWNAMLRTMITGIGNQAYGKKVVNTIIYATPRRVQTSFSSRLPKKQAPTYGPDFYWTSRGLRIFVAMLVKGSLQRDKYDMYDCGYQYLLARLDPGNNYWPIHLHGYATKTTTGSLPLRLNNCCVIR